jgi:hypothetical protein
MSSQYAVVETLQENSRFVDLGVAFITHYFFFISKSTARKNFYNDSYFIVTT